MEFGQTPPNSHSSRARRSNASAFPEDGDLRAQQPSTKRTRLLSQLTPETRSCTPHVPQPSGVVSLSTTTSEQQRRLPRSGCLDLQEHYEFEDLLSDPGMSDGTTCLDSWAQYASEASVSENTPENLDQVNIDELVDTFYETSKNFPEQKLGECLDLGGVEEEGWNLLMEPPSFQEPPSSVLKGLDLQSRSENEFDPELQYSSPKPNGSLKQSDVDDNPSEADMDWDLVRTQARRRPGLSSNSSSQTRRTHALANPASAQGTTATQPSKSSQGRVAKISTGKMLLKPFKTFFSLQEMLETKEEMFKNQPKAEFELFARISYSSRENFIHKQHFQFKELLKELPPFLNGTLAG